jgi:non-haem Fe2+, alpha-ketoglutarate-dependent halogenase
MKSSCYKPVYQKSRRKAKETGRIDANSGGKKGQTTMTAITAADSRTLAARFEEDGFVSGIRVFDPEEAARVRRAFDALEAREGRESCQIGLLDRHFDQPFVMEMAANPVILDAVQAVMGPDVMLLATHFFCKYPAEGTEAPAVREAPEKFVAWHQDVTYWGLEPPFALTAWYAVDDSDVENGCMRVIPGTHRGIRQHGTSGRAGNLLSINQEVPVTPQEEARAVDLCLRAGEISLHHGMLIHGSNPNRSARRRCGLTLRYMPPSVRVVAENSVKRPWQPLLLRGEDRYGHFAGAGGVTAAASASRSASP